MPKPRYTQISLEASPYYHCTSRCVRRAYLCGADTLTGQSYEHRRQWVEDKILHLAQVFAIDLCAYAVMSNHYHVVLHINKMEADSLKFDEIIDRWHKLYKGNIFSQRYVKGEPLSAGEMGHLKDIVDKWRDRLMSASWFMRNLNEPIAREANKEDDCTGRFWEGRFSSQALLDEAAILSCMAYVDLNPIRARVAATPETSDHTSIKYRIVETRKSLNTLYPFVGNYKADMPEGIPFNLKDYIELVDWTGRIIRNDKRGYIEPDCSPILKRIEQDEENWLVLTQNFEKEFKVFAGAAHQVTNACETLGYQRRPGIKACSRYFN